MKMFVVTVLVFAVSSFGDGDQRQGQRNERQRPVIGAVA